MRKMEVTRKQTTFECGEMMTLVYSVTIDGLAAEEHAGELEDYGVCIDILESGESACVRGVTLSAAAIGGLAAHISESLVTPCTLYDVVYDWLCRE